MPRLKSAARKKLPSAKFGLPKERKYPIEDKEHAINAKARAAQMVKKGKLSLKAEKEIDKRANKVIRKKAR